MTSSSPEVRRKSGKGKDRERARGRDRSRERERERRNRNRSRSREARRGGGGDSRRETRRDREPRRREKESREEKEKESREKERENDRKRSKRDGRRKESKSEEHPTPAPVTQEEAVLGRSLSKMAGPGEAPVEKVKKWKEELAKPVEVEVVDGDDDGDKEPLAEVEVEEDDAVIQRRLEESRARREALIAKWVNRGETENGTVVALDSGTAIVADGEDAESEDEVSDNEKPEGDANLSEEQLKEKKSLHQFILSQKAEEDDDNMFDVDADEATLARKRETTQAIGQTGASGHDWDDAEGYYKAKVGEVMADRYLVTDAMCGMGVFSNVVKATDQETKKAVAIKVMRANDMMRKAAEKEVEILEKLGRNDRANRKHCIRLLKTFMYRGHMCLVFECMWDNLRVALEKYTKKKGMSLPAIRSYTKQLLTALRHIHKCNIIHADIKPDNILISNGHNEVKICDMGSGFDVSEVEITPILVSRWYRAPEIVLGKEYGCPIDTFAMGCSLVELFTGKTLFPGRSNNDMLRLYMEYKGKIPHKMIKSGTTWKEHFNDKLDFLFVDINKVTRKTVVRTVTDCSQKKTILDMVMTRVGTDKQRSDQPDDQLYVKKAKQFSDLIEKMTALDPEKRITPNDALEHPFIKEGFGSQGLPQQHGKAKAPPPSSQSGGAQKRARHA